MVSEIAIQVVVSCHGKNAADTILKIFFNFHFQKSRITTSPFSLAHQNPLSKYSISSEKFVLCSIDHFRRCRVLAGAKTLTIRTLGFSLLILSPNWIFQTGLG
ncbi:hypothetical protein L1987_41117 [Smallanthus sonchifolius]|uniref:Uncharacterized protein n=1 Tax=Smallanthus sonchifolius TaxID=185202 RepID=A0ACB9GUZ1_9ASTR|nr:hypothetical protein L1987_41117 [Smallanthus sonchifolius]